MYAYIKVNSYYLCPQSISRKRRYVAGASVRSKIYVIGGYDGTARLSSVDCLDLVEEEPQWHSVAPMNHRRGLAGVTVYQGALISYHLRWLPGYEPKLHLYTVNNNVKKHMATHFSLCLILFLL